MISPSPPATHKHSHWSTATWTLSVLGLHSLHWYSHSSSHCQALTLPQSSHISNNIASIFPHLHPQPGIHNFHHIPMSTSLCLIFLHCLYSLYLLYITGELWLRIPHWFSHPLLLRSVLPYIILIGFLILCSSESHIWVTALIGYEPWVLIGLYLHQTSSNCTRFSLSSLSAHHPPLCCIQSPAKRALQPALRLFHSNSLP